jgi:hypothetical protein
VKRYLDLFSDNVLIIKFDDFKNDLMTAYEKVCSFLGIKVNEFSPEIHNVSRDVYSPKLQFILRKITIVMNIARRQLFFSEINTKKSRDWLLDFGLKNATPLKMSNKTRDALLKKYEEDIKQLSRLTKINFDDWLRTYS